MYQERYNSYDRAKKLFLVLVGLAGLAVSYSFSVDGFGIDVEGKRWAGWVMGFLITGFQLVLNAKKDGKSLSTTLVVLGLIAYIYGIWTNVNGILLSQGDGFTITNAIKTKQASALVLPSVIGFLLEVGPEPLLAYAIFGNAALIDVFGSLGDFFGSGRRTHSSPGGGTRGSTANRNSSSAPSPARNSTQTRSEVAKRSYTYPTPKDMLSLGGNASPTYHPAGVRSREDDNG